MTQLLAATPDAIRRAADVLRGGGLVAFPTETVYGLGAWADHEDAVRSIFTAKGRPANHPLIVHLADAAALADWASVIPIEAQALAAAFWPGPLTMILRRRERVNKLVTGGLDTIGLRVPAHPVAQELLRELGGAIAAPSANRFGRVSPTTARHVLEELNGLVDMILDGGDCQVGLESTIIDLSRGQPAVLRPGGITAEQLAEVLGPLAAPKSDAPRVSGSLESHYAPRARVELLSPHEIAPRAEQLRARGLRVAVLSREPEGAAIPRGAISIALPADDEELAQRLYSLLRQVDDLGCDVALATIPDQRGIGVAIADRLRKAAGPRESD